MFGSGNQQPFSFAGTSSGTNTTGTQSTTAATGSMDNKPGGFTFGQNTGIPQTTGAATTGYSFGTAGTNPAPASGFNLGNTGVAATSSTAPASGFTFGNTGAAATTSTAPGSGFTFGNTGAAATASAAPATGFNLGNVGTAATTSAVPATGFRLGNTGTGATSTAAAPQGTAAPGGFSFGTTPTVTGVQAVKPLQSTTGTTSTAAGGGTGFGLGTLGGGAKPSITTTSGAAAPSTGFSFNTATTTSTPGGLLGTAATSTAAATTTTGGATVGFSLPVQSTTSHPTTSAATAGLAPAATTSTAAAPAPSGLPQAQITYQQLEENINKWMADLEKQERDFLQQATQVNAWDRLLVENGEKITGLNGDMERVKIDQQKLDHELDFIKSQQRELEELLVPLEKSVDQQTSNFQHHADLERDNTYQLAENVDAQLKRMVVDLKEIIDHLNTNSSQDNADPIQQITKILNAHMDALQWVDQNTALLGRKIEDVAKQMEVQRKEQERNFRLVYN